MAKPFERRQRSRDARLFGCSLFCIATESWSTGTGCPVMIEGRVEYFGFGLDHSSATYRLSTLRLAANRSISRRGCRSCYARWGFRVLNVRRCLR